MIKNSELLCLRCPLPDCLKGASGCLLSKGKKPKKPETPKAREIRHKAQKKWRANNKEKIWEYNHRPEIVEKRRAYQRERRVITKLNRKD